MERTKETDTAIYVRSTGQSAASGKAIAGGVSGEQETATHETGLSPADPARDSDEGMPYLDDTNPYGRDLPNRENRPLGGTGVLHDADPAAGGDRNVPGERSVRPEARRRRGETGAE